LRWQLADFLRYACATPKPIFGLGPESGRSPCARHATYRHGGHRSLLMPRSERNALASRQRDCQPFSAPLVFFIAARQLPRCDSDEQWSLLARDRALETAYTPDRASRGASEAAFAKWPLEHCPPSQYAGSRRSVAGKPSGQNVQLNERQKAVEMTTARRIILIVGLLLVLLGCVAVLTAFLEPFLGGVFGIAALAAGFFCLRTRAPASVPRLVALGMILGSNGLVLGIYFSAVLYLGPESPVWLMLLLPLIAGGWILNLTPALLVRFVLLARHLQGRPAVLLSMLFFAFLVVAWIASGQEVGRLGPIWLFLVYPLNYLVLRIGAEKAEAAELRELLASTGTKDTFKVLRETLAQSGVASGRSDDPGIPFISHSRKKQLDEPARGAAVRAAASLAALGTSQDQIALFLLHAGVGEEDVASILDDLKRQA